MTEQLEREIESGSVIVDVMLSSTPTSLLRRLEGNSTLQEAIRELSAHPENVGRLLGRAEALFGTPAVKGFLSEQDQPLSAYLYLLGATSMAESRTFILRVAASNRADLRYARWVAEYWAVRASEKSLAGAA